MASGSWSSAPLRSRRVAVRWDRQRAGGTCTRAPALVDAVVALELAGLPLPTGAVATGLRRDNRSEAPDCNSPHQAKVYPGAVAAGPPRWQPRGRVAAQERASGEILVQLAPRACSSRDLPDLPARFLHAANPGLCRGSERLNRTQMPTLSLRHVVVSGRSPSRFHHFMRFACHRQRIRSTVCDVLVLRPTDSDT